MIRSEKRSMAHDAMNTKLHLDWRGRSAMAVLCTIAALAAFGESRAEALTWSQYCTSGSPPCGGSQPTLAGSQAIGTASLPTLIPLAVWTNGGAEPAAIFALSTTTNANDDYELWAWTANGGWSAVTVSNDNVYLRGVVFDGETGDGYGWTKAGQIWSNASGTWSHVLTSYSATSFGAYDFGVGAEFSIGGFTNMSASCSHAGDPAGQCLELNASGDGWSASEWGGAMITVSGDDFTYDVLDSSGNVWVSTLGAEVATTTCSSASIGFDAIAVNNAIGELGLDNSSGGIWNRVSCNSYALHQPRSRRVARSDRNCRA